MFALPSQFFSIQILNASSQALRQGLFGGGGVVVWANACQKRPKLREIKIAPVIFRFIDFTSFTNRSLWKRCEAVKVLDNGSHSDALRYQG